ncbi:MAG: alpha/beta fold hydrolase [Anaerolineae bacterium]|nr:alpha/beta fold hydrolase [Anaerolineae bacterium]
MKALFGWLVVLLMIPVALPAPASAQEGVDPLAIAQAAVDHLIAGDYEAAAADFDAQMIQAVPDAALQQVWEQLVQQAGPLQEQGTAQTATQGEFTIVTYRLLFERAAFEIQITISGAGQVAGLFLRPAATEPALPWEPPTYADPSAFVEREIVLNEGSEWELPGVLSMPQGEGPFPAVVLVHGSGPNDRDETIGPNKPFADLAYGLASQGIAVLRYDKRTLVHGTAMVEAGDLTVNDETVDDALAAVALLRQTDGIDPDRVFVLGHSLGGYLAPRIASRDPNLTGLIILAGSTRSLVDSVRMQSRYLAMLDGELSEADEAALAELETVLQATENVQPGDDPATLLFNTPASYWLDLKEYDPAALAAELALPMLILQGGRDYQVTLDDFAGWEAALGHRDDVTLRVYPDLNHGFFVSGEGPGAPAEYEQPGHVAAEVIEDIARWILAH